MALAPCVSLALAPCVSVALATRWMLQAAAITFPLVISALCAQQWDSVAVCCAWGSPAHT